MLPPQMFGHPDGYIFETIDEGGRPAVAIHTGPVLQRVMRGMRRSVAALAHEGSNVLMDDVLFAGEELADYRRVLSGVDLKIVGLVAPLEVLEQRERDRGDRAIGLARWQYDRVHQGLTYDLTVDTAQLAPQEVARVICKAFDL